MGVKIPGFFFSFLFLMGTEIPFLSLPLLPLKGSRVMDKTLIKTRAAPATYTYCILISKFVLDIRIRKEIKFS